MYMAAKGEVRVVHGALPREPLNSSKTIISNMLLKFVNRERELAVLEERYRSGRPELVVIYGRRRVGKTSLIRQFITGKPHVYFLAKKKKVDDERERFRQKFMQEQGIFLPEATTWDGVFEGMHAATKGRLVVVIDEFPFWVEKDRSVLSDIQHLWDETLQNTKVMLILCGSAVSVMETHVLGYGSPLYGRRTAQLEGQKLGFMEVVKFFPTWTLEDCVRAYGALDGIPFYLREFGEGRDFGENVAGTFWNTGSPLNKEAEFLLSQELREVEVYLAILRSVFEGATKLQEIASKSGVLVTNVLKYLKVLIDLKLVAAEVPIAPGRAKQKGALYRIADNFLMFWLSYVYPFRDDIEIGETAGLEAFFRRDYPRYLGFVFEQVCLQMARLLPMPVELQKVGRWWYKNVEIDMVCLDEEKQETFFAECKWSAMTRKEARNVLEALREKAAAVPWRRRKEVFGLFAKKIEGKAELRKEGFVVYDLQDMSMALRARAARATRER